MKMNSSNIMFFLLIMFTNIMSMSSNSMIFIWMNMEINMIGFLPLISKSKLMNDQNMKYMIIQSISSSTMMISILMNMMMETNINSSNLLLTSMLIKLGLIPMHLWLPNLMQSMSWNNCLILMTIQKIPMTIMIVQMIKMKLLLLSMALSLMISPLLAMNQSSFKKILAYSSISSSTWMILALTISSKMFMLFMMTYFTLLTLMIKMMKNLKMNFLSQINKTNKTMKITMIINMLSMSGMPPLTGFLPKWLILQNMTLKLNILLPILIISSILEMYMYVKLINPTMMNSSKMKKNKIKNINYKSIIIINMMTLPMMILLK